MKSLNPMMIQQYFFLCVIGALFIRIKNFMPSSAAGLSIVFLILFALRVYRTKKTPAWWAISFTALLTTSLVFVSPVLIYSHFPIGRWVLTGLLCLCFFVASFKTDFISRKKLSLLYSSIFLLIGVTVIFTSPKPRIDVHEMLTRSSSLILKGESPYHNRAAVPDEEYYISNGMKGLLDLYTEGGRSLGFVPYSPQILFISTLGYFFGDVRLGFVICLALSIFVLGLIIKNRDNFKILASVLISISVFLIEQAWSEPVVFLLFVTLIWAHKSDHLRLTPFLVGLLALSKVYMLPIVGFYIVAESKNRAVQDFFMKISLLFLGLILPYLTFMLLGVDNVISHVSKDLLFLNDFDYPFSNSFANHLDRQMNLRFYFFGPLLMLGIFIWASVLSKKRSLEEILLLFSLSLFLFMLFNKTFFYNYAWICVLMLLVCRGLTDWTKLISFDDFSYFSSRLLIVFFLPMTLSDVWHYAALATQMLQGKTLYLDFVFEYPPLSALQIFFPGWLAFQLGNMNIMFYRLIFMLSCLPADWMLFRALKLKKPNSVSTYLVCSTLLAPLIFERLDLVMMWFVVVSILYALEKRENKSIFFTTLGGWYKIIPFISFILLIKNSPNKKILIYKFFGFNLLILTAASFLFKSETLSFLSYHSNRPYQIESLVSSIAIFCKMVFDLPVSVENSFGSGNLIFSGWKIFLLVNKMCMLGSLGFLSFLYFKNKISGKDLIAGSFLLLVTLSSVLSTQYILWIMVSFAFSDYHDRVSNWFRRSMIVVSALSLAVFLNYFDLVMLKNFAATLLLARNLFLVAMSAYLLKFLLKTNAEAAPRPST